MSNATAIIQALWHNEKGATAIEYAFLISLVALVCVGALTLLGGELSGVFGDISAELQ